MPPQKEYNNPTEEPKTVQYLGTLLKECHKDWYYSYKEERNYYYGN